MNNIERMKCFNCQLQEVNSAAERMSTGSPMLTVNALSDERMLVLGATYSRRVKQNV